MERADGRPAGKAPSTLSRPQRIVRNLIRIPLAVLLVWPPAGGEALTPERAFRRAENFSMIGPSELSCEET